MTSTISAPRNSEQNEVPAATGTRGGPPSFSMIPGEEVIRRPARALIGWMSEPEALTALLGRNPIPTDDLGSFRSMAAAARRSVEALPRRPFDSAVVDDADPQLASTQSREDVAANFPGLDWRAAFVDLRKVISFQKIIAVDGLEDRLAGAASSAGLLDLCVPPTQPAHPLGAFNDPDQKGFTIASTNPNLRVAGAQVGAAEVSPQPGTPTVRMQAVTFLVHMGTSYLQVVEYRGRSFVRDGYHRAAGLLRRGITTVPCIYITAQSFEQVGLVPGSFTYESLFGDHPPFVSDFWDNSVSADIEIPAVRKIVRVRAEEFVVSR